VCPLEIFLIKYCRWAHVAKLTVVRSFNDALIDKSKTAILLNIPPDLRGVASLCADLTFTHIFLEMLQVLAIDIVNFFL